MGGMILCRSRRIQQPYFVEELGLHLYSGEELSYYIFHNAILIGEDFLDERLFRFIGQELGMINLEAKLRRWAQQADLSELLLVILQDIHYYDSKELAAFREKAQELERMTRGQRMKAKAEALLKMRKYAGAILQYDRLLHSRCAELENVEFCSSARRGQGIAYARQFDWQKAAECLELAYRQVPMESTMRMLYQITCQSNVQIEDKELIRSLAPEQKEAWKREWEAAVGRARFTGKGQEASQWMDKEPDLRATAMKELVEGWKKEYRQSQGG